MEKKKSDFERLVIINDKLLTFVEKELEKETAPSKEVLDAIKIIIPTIVALHKEISNDEASDVIIETKTTLADFLPQEWQFHQEKARPNRLKLE